VIKPDSLPSGTLTFFFSDIERSTSLLQRLGEDAYREVLQQHQKLLRDAIRARHGIEVGSEGDSLFAVFESTTEAVQAAVEGQRALASFTWPQGIEVRVRMGLHTGEGRLGGDNYVGLDVHRGARIAAAASGGQVIVSATTAALVEGRLPDGVGLMDLGQHRLKDLSRPEHIHQLVISDLPSQFPSLKSLDARPNNLPLQLTSFVGRTNELRRLRELLGETRILTLTGPGGTGKTRLSVHLAADVIGDFEHGAFFVPLATVWDTEQVPVAIAEALRLQEVRGDDRPPLTRVSDYLSTKEMLLVLDNFEQVLDAAQVVSDLARAAEGLRLIVTSRAALRIYGEREFPVPPLALPDPHHLPALETLSQFEAVALFIQRALAVRPDFQVTNENAPAVAAICARLDGLPLAIELAAARIRVLTPEALHARLEERLKVLVGGSRDVPARQRTLRQAIEWSYELLDESDRMLFGRLAAFMGSFGLVEAEKVCSPGLGTEVLDGISSLVDKSLLRMVNDQASEPRYFMLETIREYALEKLNSSRDAEVVRRRLAETYTELAEAAAGELHTLRQRELLDRLEKNHDNLRVAHDWACDRGEREIALRLSTALWRFWQMRGHLQEGRRRIEAALQLSVVSDRSPLRAAALQAAGGIAYWQSDLPAQIAYYDEALELWRDLGDKGGIAGALYDAGFAWDEWGALPRARPYLEESLALYREIGDRRGEANVLWGFAVMQLFTKEYPAAEANNKASLEIAREVGDVFQQMWSLYELGYLALETGQLRAAGEYLREALELGTRAGDVSVILFVLDSLATLAQRISDVERAVRLRAAVTAIKAESGASLVDSTKEVLGVDLIEREGIGEQRLLEVWAEGERMPLDDVIAYALGQ
jgi:predicted ATPase/class 3 adenylate cyclase